MRLGTEYKLRQQLKFNRTDTLARKKISLAKIQVFLFRAIEEHVKLQHSAEINFASNKITNLFGRLKITLLVKHVEFRIS